MAMTTPAQHQAHIDALWQAIEEAGPRFNTFRDGLPGGLPDGWLDEYGRCHLFLREYSFAVPSRDAVAAIVPFPGGTQAPGGGGGHRPVGRPPLGRRCLRHGR